MPACAGRPPARLHGCSQTIQTTCSDTWRSLISAPNLCQLRSFETRCGSRGGNKAASTQSNNTSQTCEERVSSEPSEDSGPHARLHTEGGLGEGAFGPGVRVLLQEDVESITLETFQKVTDFACW